MKREREREICLERREKGVREEPMLGRCLHSTARRTETRRSSALERPVTGSRSRLWIVTSEVYRMGSFPGGPLNPLRCV